MKAKRSSRCTLCSDQIEAGDEIGALLGKWTHLACKQAEIARRTKSAGAPEVLPPVLPDNEKVTYIGARLRNRQGIAFLKSRDRL
ncbi:hypothetical protein AB0942_33205 [Streptomyces nodosus]|uniref:hypothetical protein n=1 Tax=Streptomyces nodosus TaxID=40318 RepID=UPI003454A7FA